jgi:hypothetical protein
MKYASVRHFDLITSAVFSLVVLGFMTGYDIANHDTYILPSYQCDDPNGKYYNSEFCISINGKNVLNVPLLNYAFEISQRDTYWLWLNLFLLAFASMLGFIRWAIGRSIKAGLMWSLTIMLPVLSGFEDAIYFMGRGLPIPQEMPWLEENVFVGTVNRFYTPQNTVTPMDLYVSMGIAITILAIAWFLALRHKT